ncbi:MAG: hypothetical protein ACRDJF_08135 [Actinomycetota bacterium]
MLRFSKCYGWGDGKNQLFGRLRRRVRTANPHAVTFVEDVESAFVTELGPLAKNHPVFAVFMIGPATHAFDGMLSSETGPVR